jgi:hypothetical protein
LTTTIEVINKDLNVDYLVYPNKLIYSSVYNTYEGRNKFVETSATMWHDVKHALLFITHSGLPIDVETKD